MTRYVRAALLLLPLAACATPPPAPLTLAHGNYAQASPEQELSLVSDVVKRLMIAYPSASTRLNLLHPARDAFGVALLASLRGHGYAVSEREGVAKTTVPSVQPGKEPLFQNPVTAGVRDFRYIVDKADTDVFRVSLWIGARSMSRAYQSTSGKSAAVSPWMNGE